MATNQCTHKNPLIRTGTNQRDRFLPALLPNAIAVEERTVSDWMDYAYRYAKHIHFFEGENATMPSGNWETFFAAFKEETLSEIESKADNEPHLALFLTFLKLLQYANNYLNELPKRHLDFYFKQVLQLKKKSFTPDKVHLIIELAKNANQQFIPKGTAFNSGKDTAGKLRKYVTTNDTVLNRVEVAFLRSVLNDNGHLHFATVANSLDGLGTPLSEDESHWALFGHTELPKAAVGFALASPVLLLREGQRTINIKIELSGISLTKLKKIQNGIESQNSQVFLSGEKEWIGPFSPTLSWSKSSNSRAILVDFLFTIGDSHKPILPFNPNNLTGAFNTTAPIARIIFKPESRWVQYLKNAQITRTNITVKVTGVKEVKVEGDFGALEISKPFAPFGPVPKVGSSCYIGSDEIFSKQLFHLSMQLQWQNPPADLATHYKTYTNEPVSNNDFKATVTLLNKNTEKSARKISLFDNTDAGIKHTIDIINIPTDTRKPSDKYVQTIYEPSYLQALRPGQFVPLYEQGKRKLTQKARAATPYRFAATQLAKINFSLLGFSFKERKDSFLKLTLDRNFGHVEYPTIYNEAIASQLDDKVKDIDKTPTPSKPYTPFLESLTVDYHSETGWVQMDSAQATKEAYQKRAIQFFHITPFGQAERHPYLSERLPYRANNAVRLLPTATNTGEFYIGLSEIQTLETFQLLFQTVEGSANPIRTRPTIQWSVLANNYWLPLTDEHVLADFTNGFLQSGIIQFYLPSAATTTNSLLEEGYYWLRASISGPVDAVNKMIAVHGQAIQVIFQDEDNSLEHLDAALPAKAISKLEKRLPKIKKIQQPYSSFGGKPTEKDAAFYQRISERLRHKNRAISIWDYEHLVLEQFPSIFKVKCLNHTSTTKEIAPGFVTLIAVPNLQNQSATNRLRPRISAQKISEIEDYLKERSSFFTTIKVQNPVFEEVKVSFKVAFHSGFEFGFYKKQLNQALLEFLTPWAYDLTLDVTFGGAIQKSELIYFIEQLEYVDYLTDFFMLHLLPNGHQTTDLDYIETTNARAILVSAESHQIQLIEEA